MSGRVFSERVFPAAGDIVGSRRIERVDSLVFLYDDNYFIALLFIITSEMYAQQLF